MKNTHLYARPAGSAIVATLALLATPAIAQDAAEPVIVAQTPSANPAPTIVIPDPIVIPEAEPAVAPVVAPAAAAVAERSAPTTTAAPTTSAAPAPAPRRAPARSEPASSVVSSDPAPIVYSPAVADAAPVAIVPPVAVAAPVTAPAPIASAPDAASDGSTGLMVAGGAAAALSILALFLAASARRRRRAAGGEALVRPAFEPATQRSAVAATPAAVTSDVTAPVGFVVSHAVERDRNLSKWDDPVYVNAAPAAVAGRAVPDTPAGRKALIDRLVRARPDHSNPFRSLAARRRRARLIVQSMAQRMREQPNFDFRRFYDSFGRRDPVRA